MMSKAESNTLVLKVGGSFFDDHEAQSDFFAALSVLQAQGKKVIVVHGGGAQVQTQLAALGFVSEKHQGLRITPREHMPIVTGVLCGSLNKQLVASAQKQHIRAVGLSLADGAMVKCTALSPALGQVGKPTPDDPSLLNALLEAGFVPMISSIGDDREGNLYNVNADDAATCVAQLLNAQLYLLSDVAGVLDGNKCLVPELTADIADELIAQGVIKDGMLVKVQAAQQAATALNKPVNIASWLKLSSLVSASSRSGKTAVYGKASSTTHSTEQG